MRKSIRVDQDRVLDIGARESHCPSALWVGQARKHCPSMCRHSAISCLRTRYRELDLTMKHIGLLRGWIACPVQRRFRPAIPNLLGFSICEDATERDVVLMICSDTRKMLNDGDSELAQICFRANSGL